MKLTRLSVVLLLALGLLVGGFVAAQGVAAEAKPEECTKDCAPAEEHKAEEEEGAEAPTVLVTGGTVTSSTTLDIAVDGGAGIADGSGGENNTAISADGGTVDAGDVAAAGNGGTANAAANGGAVVVGDVNSGGNAGNTIVVGNTNAPAEEKKPEAPKPVAPKPEAPKKVVEAPKKAPAPAPRGGDRGRVRGLPATGIGTIAGESGANDALIALGALGALGAAGYGLRRRFV